MTQFINVVEGGRIEHTYEDKQYAHCEVTPGEGGFWCKAFFSNGKKVDGDHFGVNIALQAEDGKYLLGVQFRAGMNPAYFGKAKERRLEKFVTLTPDNLAEASKAEVEFFKWDQVNDTAFWEAVKKVVEVVVEALGQDKKDKREGPRGPGAIGRRGGGGL
jgi:hypothetical protein